ncbi:class A beta-lactamase-related serine hydrolase [Leptospira bourretii]|uniref:Class A beta-lactamase-related serine hydrolase n=1 Tax=Leptospira bourretii TaxID=2484962 RepID=A0A4R9INZ5_9LEPT|nr:serine hydrolase domain-containing protein [Leptospira bourretii]TGK90355.1 class A beta-lactamase-related serine hydrolase [Leptospira bourretii]TGK93621.1 class A beta-lactamase-related serine hydrolase [Leptospira bourretii]TGL30112.1 class A beta-lactamase-related serine hydrolase [Leptospira bourretii]
MKSIQTVIFLSVVSSLIVNCQKPVATDKDTQSLLVSGIFGSCFSLDTCFDQYAKTTDEGASFQVFDGSGNRFYARQSILDFNTYKPIASGSKWVTAITAMRVIDCNAGNATNCGTVTAASCNNGAIGGAISLSRTTAQVLGWTGTYANVTLRQLLSFTSGLNAGGGNGSGQASCISTLPAGASSTQKDSCVDVIRDQSTGTPGALYQYNSNHMAVAQRMLEVSCNKTWDTMFTQLIVTPLGWDASQAVWRGNSRGGIDTDGSLSGAYGLSISPAHYAGMLNALLTNGTAKNSSGTNVNTFLSATSVTEILADQYNGAKIGYSQFSAFGYRWQYGLGNWRFCTITDIPAECDKDLISHSIGINGFYPWIDKNRNYMAILAVNNTGRKNGLSLLPASSTSLFFAETVRPLIHLQIGK